jgi:hypothetical protein
MRAFIAAGFVFATATAALAVPNNPIRYPDNSERYRYGWPGFDTPVVYVNKGAVCTIELNGDEALPPADANPVILGDLVRWRALTSRGGGARLAEGKRVPYEWTISVQPTNDAGDTQLLVHTTMGRRYIIHLIAVDEHDSRGEQLVGFYPFHPVIKVEAPRRQAVRMAVAPTPAVHHVARYTPASRRRKQVAALAPTPAAQDTPVPTPTPHATADAMLTSILNDHGLR